MATEVAKPKSSAVNGTGQKPSDRTPQSENKSARFKRLANSRVPKAIKQLRFIANLSNRTVYDYSDEQRDKLVQILKDEVNALETRFKGAAPAAAVQEIF